METITRLPAKAGIIGPREITKAIEAGRVKTVVAAKNCPSELIEKMKAKKVKVELFEGDQKELGTKLGKPFHVAIVGYE